MNDNATFFLEEKADSGSSVERSSGPGSKRTVESSLLFAVSQ